MMGNMAGMMKKFKKCKQKCRNAKELENKTVEANPEG